MIERIGIDVIEVDRIQLAMQNPRFVERILTAKEREICKQPMRVGGRWAAKEAIAKAVGLHLSWHDVEILNDDQGAPQVTINHPTWDPAAHKIHLSITHERGIAAAVAVLERIHVD